MRALTADVSGQKKQLVSKVDSAFAKNTVDKFHGRATSGEIIESRLVLSNYYYLS